MTSINLIAISIAAVAAFIPGFLFHGPVAGYKIPYIQLLRVESGRITLLRDYFSMGILKSASENKLDNES
jgi:hypothetical protein